MLLQYHKINNDDSDRIQLLIIDAMEFILLISEIVAIIVAGINFTRYQFHFNLKCIVGYTVLAYYFDIMARSVIMSFEVGILKLELLFNMILAISLGLCLNIASILLFLTLHSLNKTNMEWLQNCILVVTVSNTLLAGFLVVSNHAHLKENYPVLVKYCHSFLNFGIAVYAQVAFCVCALADRNFRQYFLRFEIIRIFLKPFFGRIFPEDFKIKKTLSTSEETNVYFSKLSLQWDDTMMKNVKGVVKKRKKFLIF
ncbi:hypothetical protein B9Z55_004665 [Caenorhabditis nigoni]|uniref:Uncharacterized protein n=1 Tax=Caenorhabditis nigoni TaxID=1611254 RepID=A0A2G5UXF5_9PELO|nr:hypothetical protein B9Z55_004665 [Caenorhabditis nigoni]